MPNGLTVMFSDINVQFHKTVSTAIAAAVFQGCHSTHTNPYTGIERLSSGDDVTWRETVSISFVEDIVGKHAVHDCRLFIEKGWLGCSVTFDPCFSILTNSETPDVATLNFFAGGCFDEWNYDEPAFWLIWSGEPRKMTRFPLHTEDSDYEIPHNIINVPE